MLGGDWVFDPSPEPHRGLATLLRHRGVVKNGCQSRRNHVVAIARRDWRRTGLAMTTTTKIPSNTSASAATHDITTCPGCDHVMNIAEIAAWLGESVHTLYKWSAIGFPVFPKRLRLRNGRVATTCQLAKAWLAEVAS